MHKLLTDSPGMEMMLLGNEAIARGALEAGLAFATCYPGTPSSEIPEQFFRLSRETPLYFEYSTNEKVAMEVAAAAAISGVRTMVTMKHVGLNVAADPLMTLAYMGVKGGMVIVNADDPSLFSSQNEQDNRYYSRLSSLPTLEPANAQEMKDFTVMAFDLSEELELPVIIRTTTRLNHVRGPVRLGSLRPIEAKSEFVKNPFRYVAVPAVSRRLHKELLEKCDKASEKSESLGLNSVAGEGRLGIVANGVSRSYVADAVKDLEMESSVRVLNMGFSWPLPKKLCAEFMRSIEKLLVVEELEPVMENDLKAIAQESGLTLPIRGKGVGELSRLYEYDPGMVRAAVAEFAGISYEPARPPEMDELPELPARPPNLCAGCPHRATFYAVKEVYGVDAITPTDIGCYTLGLLPPLSMGDMVICMGSSVSTSCGFAQATGQKVVSFIGDSTFFHSGITGLVNAVHNNHRFTLVIMDNGTTAMTGHQPHPGVEPEPLNQPLTRIPIDELVRGCGVKDIHVVKPFKVRKTIDAIRASMEYDGISVVISQEFCPLFARATGRAKRVRPFAVRGEKCRNHRACIDKLACPAMYLEGGQVKINRFSCTGCALCAQICPENAILPEKE